MRIAICAPPNLGPCGGARVIVEIANRLCARGHDAAIVSDGFRTNWISVKSPILTYRQAGGAGLYDVVMATGHNTVPLVQHVAANQRFYYVQMLEHLFYGEGSPSWHAARNSYPMAKDNGFQFICIATWQQAALMYQWGIEAAMIPVAVNRKHFYPDGFKAEDNPYVLVEGDGRNYAKDVDGIGFRVAEAIRHEFGYKLYGFAAYRHAQAAMFDRFITTPTEQEMRKLYSGAQFMIKASKYEGRAGAVSEAMVCGTACARAIIEGDEDLIDYQTGLRVGYDEEALLGAARMLACQPALRRFLERNCLEYTQTHLLWEPVIDQLEEQFCTQNEE